MKQNFISLVNRLLRIATFLALLFVGNIPLVQGQQNNPAQCVANIQNRLETLGDAANCSYTELRTIIRGYDYGKIPDAVADPGKAAAFKRVFTSLSEIIDLAPNDISGKAMKGYTRLSGGIIRADGTDYVADLKKVFGGTNFDGPGFNKVMEQLDGTGTWKNQTNWESPGGLTYSTAPDLSHGHRISHLFNHTVADPDKALHSVFSVSRKDLLRLIDEGWQNQAKYHPLKANGAPDERVWIVDMGRPIGTNGETLLRIVVDSPGSSNFTSAYPFTLNP